MLFRFTLSHDDLGDLVINEPGGWKDMEAVLSRHEEFHSLIKSLDGDFVFYGNDGEVDGGYEFIKEAIREYGFKTLITLTIDYAPEYSLTYTNFFTGLIDNESIEWLPDNKVKCDIIRDDFWSKFINNLDKQVNVMSTTDLEGNTVPQPTPIELELPPQLINQYFIGYLPVSTYNFDSGVPANGYIQIDFDGSNEFLSEAQRNEVVDDIEEHISGYPIITNSSQPYPIFQFENPGDVVINDLTIVARHATDDSTTHLDADIKGYLFDGVTEHLLTRTNYLGSDGVTRRSRFIYTGSATLTGIRTLAVYFKNDSGSTSTAVGLVFDDQVEIGVPGTYTTKFDFYLKSTYPESTCEAFLLHDLFDAVIKRIIGPDASFYSEVMGATYTKARQYGSDGCFARYAIAKGLHIRGYSLDDKSFFISFNQLWKGANPIMNLGLGPEMIGDDQVIRIESKSHYYNDSDTIDIGDIPEPVGTYDTKYIINKVKIGYNQWETEYSNDEVNGKAEFLPDCGNYGDEITLYSEFIAGGLTIEKTRRTEINKNKDYRYDNNNFIIALTVDEGTTPDTFTAEQDELFVSVANIDNGDTRYNLRISPARNFLRWRPFINGALQDYLPAGPFEFGYKFGSSDCNYNAATILDDEDSEPCDFVVQGIDLVGALVNESFDWPITSTFYHRAELLDFVTPLDFDDFEFICENPKDSIGISQTDSGFQTVFIKEIRQKIFRGEATLKVWPKELFEIEVIEQEIVMNDCVSGMMADVEDPETCYRITETEFIRITEDGDSRIVEECDA